MSYKYIKYIPVDHENSLVFFQSQEPNVKIYAINQHGFIYIIDDEGHPKKISRAEFSNDFGFSIGELQEIIRSRGQVQIATKKSTYDQELVETQIEIEPEVVVETPLEVPETILVDPNQNTLNELITENQALKEQIGVLEEEKAELISVLEKFVE